MENQMSEKENQWLSDETLEQFGEFMTMIEEQTGLSQMDHFDCSVCMDLLHLPHQIDPCRHTFCQSCLIRLSQARRSNCPMCRGAINGTKLNLKLHLALWTQHFDDYENRYNVELESGVYDIPMDWTVQLDSSSEDEEIAWTVTDLIGFYEERIRNARQN